MPMLRVFVLCCLTLLAAGAAGAQQAAAPAWHGLTVETVTPQSAKELGLVIPFGAVVTVVDAGSPAAVAKIAEKDVIISVGAAHVLSREDFAAAMEPLALGATVELGVISQGATRTVPLTLAARPAPKAAIDTAEGDPVLMLDTGGHMALINGLAFTPDGQQIVSAGEDKVVRVWDWAKGTTVRTFRGEVRPGSDGKIFAMALSPPTRDTSRIGPRWLAVGGYVKGDGNEIRLYDFATGRLEQLLAGHTNVVLGLAFSPDGRTLISGSDDKSAILWDVASGRLLHRLVGHSAQEVSAVGSSPDGARAVTGSYDQTLRLWETATGKLLGTMTGHADQVRALAISPSDGTIASGSADGEIIFWDGRTGQLKRHFVKQATSVATLAFSPDGKVLLSGTGTAGQGTDCHVWDAVTGKELVTYRDHNNIVLAAAISPDGRLAATGGGNNQEIHVWDLASGQRRAGPDGQPLSLVGMGRSKWAVGFSADGRSMGWGNTAHGASNQLSSLQFQISLPTANEHLGQPQSLTPEATDPVLWRRAVSKVGALSLVHRKGGNFRYDAILDIHRDGETTASIERGPTDGYGHWSYTFTPDGHNLISGGAGGELHAYGLDGKKRGEFVGHEGVVWAVATSPDGRFLVSGSDDQTIRLWNLNTYELIVTLFHGSDNEWVMWTPQGYFTGSPGGAEIVGWQLNHGPEHEATYVKGIQLRNVLNRPDIVERAIVLASAKQAVAELVPADSPTLSQLVRHPPPNILMYGPDSTATGRAAMVMEVERTGTAVQSWDINLLRADNGIDHKLTARPVAVPADYKRRHDDRDLVAFEVDLRKGGNVLGVVAHTAIGDSLIGTEGAIWQVQSSIDAPGSHAGTLRILAIGVDKYPDAGPGFGSLRYAAKDARDFAAIVEAQMGKSHDKTVVEVMASGAGGEHEPTRANIEVALQQLRDAPDKSDKDTVALFVASHGENRDGKYLLLPTDFQRRGAGDPGRNAVPWTDIRDALAKMSGQRLVFLDTCHAGGASNDTLSGETRSYAFTAFTGAKANQFADEDAKLQQGRFTYAIRQGLGGGAIAKDNTIKVYDLGKYLADETARLSNGAQEAEYWPGTGNFVLVQR